MSFFKKIFGKKEKAIESYQDFWEWFVSEEHQFFEIVKRGKRIDKDFFGRLDPKINAVKSGMFYSAGMYTDDIAELIITPEGSVKNIAFAEELVESAPNLKNWKFTALKSALDMKDINIQMNGYTFDASKISFYSVEHEDRPDEVDIRLVHEDYDESDSRTIVNGTYIYIDHLLGELNSVVQIDNSEVISGENAESDLIPIEKLADFLNWREKEFIERYNGTRRNTENDDYSGLEATLKNGLPMVAIVNTALLNWDKKASHPWIVSLSFKYDGEENNGMPDPETYQLLNQIEDELMELLKDSDGYLNVGRQTADSYRDIFFACKEFRKPSKVLYGLDKKYSSQIECEYSIFKDKYWKCLDRFRPQL